MYTSLRVTILGLSAAVSLALVASACSKESAPPGGEETGGTDDTKPSGGGAGGKSNATGGKGGTTPSGEGGSGGTSSAGGSPSIDGPAPTTDGPAPTADTNEPPPVDAAAPPADAGPARILFFTRTNGTTHVQGIIAAVAALKTALGPSGITIDVTMDAAMITTANLARYAGIVLVSTSGAPFGDPGTAQVDAIVAFVKAGGGLAGFHAASSTDYEPTGAFVTLLGADTKDQGGGFRNSNCFPEAGGNPSVAKLPTPYMVTNEEFYTFNNLNPANQVVLRCDPATGTEKIPISWVRQEGAGRIFYTSLGHYPAIWTANGRFVMDHAAPAVLWTIGR